MRLKLLYSGAWRVVAPLGAEDVCDLEMQLAEFASDKKLRASVLGFRVLWARILQTGPRCLGTALYHRVDEEQEIYEFIKGPLRLLCFESQGAVVVCSHVIRKSSQKTPRSEIKRVADLKRQYLAAQAKSEVEIIEEDGSAS